MLAPQLSSQLGATLPAPSLDSGLACTIQVSQSMAPPCLRPGAPHPTRDCFAAQDLGFGDYPSTASRVNQKSRTHYLKATGPELRRKEMARSRTESERNEVASLA